MGDFFKQFFFSNKRSAKNLPSVAQSTKALETVINDTLAIHAPGEKPLDSAKREEFSSKMSTYVYSEDFIDGFSAVIGRPKKNESEDEFVGRCKKEMTRILIGKFL